MSGKNEYHFITYAEVKWEHKRDVIFDRRLLYNTALLRSRKLIGGDRRLKRTGLGWGDKVIPVLVRLSKSEDDVGVLSHERYGGMIHEREAAIVVGLQEPVGVGKSVGRDKLRGRVRGR